MNETTPPTPISELPDIPISELPPIPIVRLSDVPLQVDDIDEEETS